MEEQYPNLAKALAAAQRNMKPAAFDRTNPHYSSSYASLASIMEACREPLASNGLAVIQTTAYVDGVLMLKTTLVHESGECVIGVYPIWPQQNTPQGYGAALTYARRYALASIVGVVSDDDDDGEAASTLRQRTVQQPSPKPAPIPQGQPTPRPAPMPQPPMPQPPAPQDETTTSEKTDDLHTGVPWGWRAKAFVTGALKNRRLNMTVEECMAQLYRFWQVENLAEKFGKDGYNAFTRAAIAALKTFEEEGK